MSKPVVIDLFCGLGGWSKGFLAEGWDAIGFDIEDHEYGVPVMPEALASKGGNGSWFNVAHGQRIDGNCAGHPTRGDNEYSRRTCISVKHYPGELILRDVLTLNGYDLAAANPFAIAASPPCQEFSYMAMPFSRGKQIAAALRGRGEFPKGYTGSRTIDDLCRLFNACFRIQRELSDALGRKVPMIVENVKGAQPWIGRAKWHYGSYYLWGDVPALMPHTLKLLKRPGRNFHAEHETRGVKGYQGGLGRGHGRDPASNCNSRSDSRKAASAMIAEIPFDLASHIARVFKP